MEGLALTADYHTHTYYSHGRGSIECNVRQAVERGLKRIGITDHGFSQPLMGLTGEKLTCMRRIIDGLNRKYQGQIEILLGVEANVVAMDGRIDVPQRYLPMLDMLAVGLHKHVLAQDRAFLWRVQWAMNASRVMRSTGERLTRACTEALSAAMNRYRVDFISHPGYTYPVSISALADAAVRAGTAIEINSAHELPEAGALKLALGRGARFVIGSDAHRPERVGDFAAGIALAEAAGIPAGSIINSTESGQRPGRGRLAV